MPATIPDAVLGATYTNEITGVTYIYDGMKWVIDSEVGGPHEHEDYVKVTGDDMTGLLNIAPAAGNIALELQAGPDAFDTSSAIRVWDKLHKNVLFYVHDNGELGTKDNYVPTSNRQIANKRYVDSFQGIFKFIEPPSNNTGTIPDGHCWVRPDNAAVWYVSYKTFNGFRWPVPSWSAAAETENYPDGLGAGSNTINWFAADTKAKMTVYDLDNEVSIFHGSMKKLYMPAFLEADGVTEKAPANLTHICHIDLDPDLSSNFTRPAEGTMLWLRFPPFL